MSDEVRIKFIPSLTPLRGIAALMVKIGETDNLLNWRLEINKIP